jgi:hypothetical protein
MGRRSWAQHIVAGVGVAEFQGQFLHIIFVAGQPENQLTRKRQRYHRIPMLTLSCKDLPHVTDPF